MRKTTNLLFVVIIIFTFIFNNLILYNTKADLNDPGILTTHDPILIVGNENFIVANGVTNGSGTKSDPYIIENWDINAKITHGIEIRDTTSYFIIRNCWLHDGHGEPPYVNDKNGIILRNVTNGVIENSRSTYNGYGIYLLSSFNITLSNNSIYSNQHDGIFLEYNSNSNRIFDNSIHSNDHGIYLEDGPSQNTIINNNIFLNTWGGFYLYNNSNNNLISNNTIDAGEWGSGIAVDSCSNNSFTKNYIRSHDRTGISLRFKSNYNVILQNEISNNSLGIGVLLSSENSISNNEVYDNTVGIFLGSSFENIITNNNVTHNDKGIIINESWDYYGTNEDSSDNYIYHNNFIENIIQAEDVTGNNYWNDTYPSGGNYWSDYTGKDKYGGPNQDQEWVDGIGDTSYDIVGNSDSLDRYPLMVPWPEGEIIYDSDQDGLPDGWEQQYFGNLSQGPNDDFDGDGFSNQLEYEEGTDPTDKTDHPNGANENKIESFFSKYWWAFLVIIAVIILLLFIIIFSRYRKKEEQPPPKQGPTGLQ